VWGADDPIAVLAMTDELIRARPDAHLTILDGVGHYPMVEAPQRFNAALAAALIPVGRPGTPEEAAGGVFFLCSPWANFVHGQVLNITGGQFTGMTT